MIARVLPLLPLAHLDREFDYRIPPELDELAQPGVRVRVRFAGRLVDGFVLERVAVSSHDGELAKLDKVVSGERVLTPALLALVTAVAARYAGTRADVLRLAIPPRHARTEKAPPPEIAAMPEATDPGAWSRYVHGQAFTGALAAGRVPRAVWQALPGEDWPARLAELAAVTVSGGASALLLVPDQRDLDRVHAACVALLGQQQVVALAAGLGPSARYRRWLAALRGTSRVIVGTRAAAFVPVPALGLVAVWDDGDDSYAEPRAPYPHAREVALLRAHTEGAAFLAGGFSRTAEIQAVLDSGWAQELVADRAQLRAAAPRITAPAATEAALDRDPHAQAARLPAIAFQAARAALEMDQPVLVQVPRGGYVPALACGKCRTPARCRRCHGPLALGGGQHQREQRPPALDAHSPACRWCGIADAAYRCPACGSRALRATVIGSERTAEELGRAFAGIPVRVSGGGAGVVSEIPGGARLVVATIGAEPFVTGGYGAALLLDGWALLGRPDLRASEETLRRWMTAAALVRPGSDGGQVIVMADPALPVVQALVRWDPAGAARAELAARAEVGFAPAVRMAAVDGSPAALAAFQDIAELPSGTEVLGPVPLPPGVSLPGADTSTDSVERLLLRVPRADGAKLSRALAVAQAIRGARKAGEPLRVQVDPVNVG